MSTSPFLANPQDSKLTPTAPMTYEDHIEPMQEPNQDCDKAQDNRLEDVSKPSDVHKILKDISHGVQGINESNADMKDIFRDLKPLISKLNAAFDEEMEEEEKNDKEEDSKGKDGEESCDKETAEEDKNSDKSADGSSEESSEQKLDEIWEGTSLEFMTKTRPTVRRCEWEEFMSRYSQDNAASTIEILLSGSDLDKKRDAWIGKLDAPNPRKPRKTPPSVLISRLIGEKKDPPDGSKDLPDSKDHKPSETSEQDNEQLWIQQIRINSRAVLKILGDFLIHHHGEMRKKLEEIKSKVGSPVSHQAILPDIGTGNDTIQPLDISLENSTVTDSFDEYFQGREKIASAVKVDDVYGRKSALAEMTCHIDFVDNQVMPDYEKFQGTHSKVVPKARYDDLWYLFRVGDLVYVPDIQTIWRVYRIKLPIDADTEGDRNIEDCSCSTCKAHRERRDRYQRWSLCCYRLDYDGENYIPINKTFDMRSYSGFKEIKKLEVYPLRFEPDCTNMSSKAQKHGEKFVDLIKARYGYHSGWTLIKDPFGQTLYNDKKEEIKSREYIESDVLVDFKEAFNATPDWRPTSDSIKLGSDKLLKSSGAQMRVWSNKQPSKFKRISTTIIASDHIDHLELKSILQLDRSSTNSAEPCMDPDIEDLKLLPNRLFAYAVWVRRFIHINVDRVQARVQVNEDPNGSGEPSKDAFDKLQIEETTKKLIQSLVSSHLKKKEMEDSGYEIGTQDLIRGKGKGIIILLHGVPGIGKTATAEAVAQRWKKPLFPITCGDLGFTPQSVQEELDTVFRLAYLWDCVLLLDEADVFITQRERHDLKRNALVSVFLRMLEYYNGIMFLTTNRAGVLDEAIKSRVHLSLRYDHLSEAQTIEVFKNNIESLRMIEEQQLEGGEHKKLHINDGSILDFAKRHYNKHADGMGRWNGRQIRNAFLIAASLAHFDGDTSKDPTLQKQLVQDHFQQGERVITLYDQFRDATLQGTDSEWAFRRSERDDGFKISERRQSTYGGPQTQMQRYYDNSAQDSRGNKDFMSATPNHQLFTADQRYPQTSQLGYHTNPSFSMPGSGQQQEPRVMNGVPYGPGPSYPSDQAGGGQTVGPPSYGNPNTNIIHGQGLPNNVMNGSTMWTPNPQLATDQGSVQPDRLGTQVGYGTGTYIKQ